MLRGSDLQKSGEAGNAWQLQKGDGAVDDWFTASTQQLRARTAEEGAFINRPSRQTVERLIDWFDSNDLQVRQ
jgi:hypothetical protein